MHKKKLELTSWWYSSRPSTGHWVQGSSNNLAFCLAKDADWWVLMRVRGLIHARPRSDCSCRRVSYRGNFCNAMCRDKSETHSTASCPLRHSPLDQVEWHSLDRTTDNGQSSFYRGSVKPNSFTADYRVTRELLTFQIACIRETDVVSGGHVMLSGNWGHHTRYSGRKHLCGCLYLRERGERVGYRLGLEIVSSAEECDRTASTFLSHNSWPGFSFSSESIICWGGIESITGSTWFCRRAPSWAELVPSVFFGFVSLSAVGDAFHKQHGLISHGQKQQLASFSTGEFSQPSGFSSY